MTNHFVMNGNLDNDPGHECTSHDECNDAPATLQPAKPDENGEPVNADGQPVNAQPDSDGEPMPTDGGDQPQPDQPDNKGPKECPEELQEFLEGWEEAQDIIQQTNGDDDQLEYYMREAIMKANLYMMELQKRKLL